MDVGAPNHEVMMKSIELFGTKVAKKVRDKFKVMKIHHIAIICSDYQVSKNFYTEILGLKYHQRSLPRRKTILQARLGDW